MTQTLAGALVSGNPPVSVCMTPGQGRITVYQNNVAVALVRALEANFPATCRLVGDAFFRAMARDFARKHPPESPLLFSFGGKLPDFIQAADQLSQYPYLADVARAEILWLQSYHAAERDVLSGGELLRIKPQNLENLRFEPHPAARLFQSPFAAISIMQVNREGGDGTVAELAAPERAVISRPRSDVFVNLVERGAFLFFAELFGGKTLGEAADSALAMDAAFDLSKAIAEMIQLGIFSSIRGGQ